MTTAAVERQHEDDEIAELERQNGGPLPLAPEIIDPPITAPPTREELDAATGVEAFRPPAPGHSYTMNEREGTLSVRCEATGAEFVLEAEVGQAAKCQGCSFEIRVERLPLAGVAGAADGPLDMRIVERDPMEQAIVLAAEPRGDALIRGVEPGEVILDEPDVFAESMVRSQQRILADIRARATPRVQIGNYAVPVQWVREQADPGCKICKGDGFVDPESARPEFCRCARTRALQRVNAAARANAEQAKVIDPKAEARTKAEAERLQRTIDGLAVQVREAEGALALRDAEHGREITTVEALLISEVGEIEAEAKRQAAAAQDAQSAMVQARAQTVYLRDYVDQARKRLDELIAELAAAEVKLLDAERDAEVASTFATEAGQCVVVLKTRAENEAARLRREHEKRTAGARNDLAKLKRRLALAEARR